MSYLEDAGESTYIDSLRRRIISQGRQIFGHQHPTGHTFDVVTDDTNSAHLVVYTLPNSFAHSIVLKTADTRGLPEYTGQVAMLLNLLEGLQQIWNGGPEMWTESREISPEKSTEGREIITIPQE